MTKIISFILICGCLSFISGCSVPSAVSHPQLYSFLREEKKIKRGITKKKIVLIKNFREEEAYEEDIASLKKQVEKYISAHPNLDDTLKNNLRELKVVEGAAKENVELLLGRPDKISKVAGSANYNASEIWIYKINKLRAFTIFILPIFFVHEGYYLYFKDDTLAGIERHYLEQIVRQGSAPGVIERKKE